ncbi:MAG: AraC family transcriptional regulator [Rhodospirillales bacterium 20-58-10]|nr:MAG: AraC family transcriptional regulator [Rhodospirillales bacterium 20-58-10]
MSKAIRIALGTFGRVALLDMDQGLVRHTHPHCHVLLKVSGADTQFAVGDGTASLTGDQAVLVNAWTPHAYVHRPHAERTLILALYIEPAWLSLLRGNWAASAGPGFFRATAGVINPTITSIGNELAQAMLAEPSATHTELLGRLMVALIERFTDWRTVSPARMETDWRVRRAIERLRDRHGVVDVMDRLAHECGLSRANFFRLFANATGMAPCMFANMLRLEHAVSEIVTGERTLGEVSDELGFSVPAHFTRFFRTHTGAAPSEFRHVARLMHVA